MYDVEPRQGLSLENAQMQGLQLCGAVRLYGIALGGLVNAELMHAHRPTQDDIAGQRHPRMSCAT